MKNQTSLEIKNQTISYITGAFGLVAGLAWNDAIKALIDYFFPFSKSTLGVKFLYAVLITFVVVMATKYIFKSSGSSSE